MEGRALVLLAAFSVFIACVHGTSAPLLLTDEDFARQTRDSDTLVLFFAPWYDCPHISRPGHRLMLAQQQQPKLFRLTSRVPGAATA